MKRLIATPRRSRSRIVLVVLFVLASLVTGVALAFSALSNGPTQDRVYGGGRIPVGSCTDGSTSFCSGVTREYSIFAVSDPQGGGDAYGTVTVGNVEFGGPVYSVRVTCLAVSGTIAEIGGIVLTSADANAVGGAFRVFVRDSGTPGAAARDGISPLFVDAPQVKPTCGDLSSNAFGNGYFPLAYGDVAVEDR
jgi:hypothetical protein